MSNNEVNLSTYVDIQTFIRNNCKIITNVDNTSEKPGVFYKITPFTFFNKMWAVHAFIDENIKEISKDNEAKIAGFLKIVNDLSLETCKKILQNAFNLSPKHIIHRTDPEQLQEILDVFNIKIHKANRSDDLVIEICCAMNPKYADIIYKYGISIMYTIKTDRIGWDEYFMQIADIVSTRSTCLRRSVGAVLVRDNRLLSTGYNGAPSNIPHCDTCLRKELNIPSGERLDICMAVHAEQNALIQCALNGISTKDTTMYVSVSPCLTCLKMLINAGVKTIVTRSYYADERSKELLEKSEIELIILDEMHK